VPGAGPGWTAEATETARFVLPWGLIDLRNAASASLRFESRLLAETSTALVQVSMDGHTWQTFAVVPAGSDWLTVDVDVSAFAGQVFYVRFVFDAVTPANGAPADLWQIRTISVDEGVARR
jgi:hypothetical protein